MSTSSLGRAAALLCAIHCLALPVAAVLLPAAAVHRAGSPMVEVLLMLVAMVGVGLTLVPGWRRHRRAAPLLVVGAGLAALGVGHALAWPEFAIGVVGGGLLLTGQWLERRASCRHGAGCACHHPNVVSEATSRSAASAPPAAAS